MVAAVIDETFGSAVNASQVVPVQVESGSQARVVFADGLSTHNTEYDGKDERSRQETVVLRQPRGSALLRLTKDNTLSEGSAS